jgi:hypothetical protein
MAEPLAPINRARLDQHDGGIKAICGIFYGVPHNLRFRAYLLWPDQAPAPTKRLSNLLRSRYWTADLIADWLWQQADTRVQTLLAAGDEPLLLWDGSVLEKPESIKSEGLCSVRSSKARRMGRIRPGFFNPPGGRPICVPGLQSGRPWTDHRPRPRSAAGGFGRRDLAVAAPLVMRGGECGGRRTCRIVDLEHVLHLGLDVIRDRNGG